MASKKNQGWLWILLIGAAVAWFNSGGKETATRVKPPIDRPIATPSQNADPSRASEQAQNPSNMQVEPTSLQQETYYTRANLRLRSEPSTDSKIVTTLSSSLEVHSIGTRGVWHKVIVNDQLSGWVHGDYISTIKPKQKAKTNVQSKGLTGGSFTCTTPIPTLKTQMIKESRSRYSGNCPCDYDSDRAGRRCGKRSAWSRPGGASPLCYPSDINANMVREFCEVLKLRRSAN